MMTEAQARLAMLLRRELEASDVRFVAPEDAPAPTPSVLVYEVLSGPTVVVAFDEPPPDHEARARRMEMIIASFPDLLTADAGRHRHSSPARTLAGELTALAGRAGALSALVVDARSPVLWGASDLYELHEAAEEETEAAHLYRKAARSGLRFETLISEPVLDTDRPHASTATGEAPESLTPDERAELWRRILLVRNALSAVRALPHVPGLHKGEHLHESVRAPEMSYVVRSFATIYMLLLVFERPFDELRAERSIAHALPTIERLVLALPPREPEPPTAGVGVVRLRRR
ncbi:MAG: hypothetical protein R3B70_41510 [Polyangiaceae bacterium]